MATHSQLQANRENAQFSTGPTSEAGRAISALNNLRHGLAGAFRVLPCESQEKFDELLETFQTEHKPTDFTESTLVEAMAQHYWLRRRALNLESSCYDPQTGQIVNEKQLSLSLRYQNTHERAFHKCLNDLLKLRAQKRKERLDEAALSKRAEDSRIGFESQKHIQEKHNMKKEGHKWDMLLAQAKIDYEQTRHWDRELTEIEASLASERKSKRLLAKMRP